MAACSEFGIKAWEQVSAAVLGWYLTLYFISMRITEKNDGHLLLGSELLFNVLVGLGSLMSTSLRLPGLFWNLFLQNRISCLDKSDEFFFSESFECSIVGICNGEVVPRCVQGVPLHAWGRVLCWENQF